MEPTDLNSPTNHDDARLETLLRQAAPPLSDDGFSARVLAALPPGRGGHLPSRRLGFGATGAAIGLACAMWRGAPWPAVQSGLGEVGAALANSGRQLGDPAVTAAVLMAVLSLLFAFRSQLREKLLS